MRFLRWHCILLLGICISKAEAQPANSNKTQEFVQQYENFVRETLQTFPEIPGIAIVVIKDDKPVFQKGFGIADKETGTKADENTLFYIASSTKSFTSLAAALLDREGIIKLDDPLVDHCQGLKLAYPIPPTVRIRDLLTHTSGLNNNALGFRMAYSGESDPAELKKVFANATQLVDSNYGRYMYTNLGYNIYAVLLQHKLGKKWQDLLQEKIFSPLKMEHSTAYISNASSKNWSVAYPYLYTADKGVIRSWLDKKDENMQSAGGIYASIRDMGRWLMMNMNHGRLEGKQVFPSEVIEACQTGYTKTVREQAPFPGDGEYGLGWQIGKYRNEKVIYHHGGFPGFRSHVSFMPDKKIAVAVMVNEGSIGGRTSHMLATYAYEWWLGVDTLQSSYNRQLKDLAASYLRTKQSLLQGVTERAKRVSQLSLPLESYAGAYSHPYLGKMEISVRDSTLSIKMGLMHCLATPYIRKEAVRVELEPGSGEPLLFVKEGDDKIGSLIYLNASFTKVQ